MDNKRKEGVKMRQEKELALTIRTSEMKDVRELIELDRIVWTEDTAPAPLVWQSCEDYLLHAPPGSQLVAADEERLYGYIGFRCPSGLESNQHVYEVHIAIHPEFRHLGIGMKLMEAVKELAARRGIRKLRVRVLSSNQRALAFYRKCGYREEGRLKEEFFLAGRYVDDVFMGLMLDEQP